MAVTSVSETSVGLKWDEPEDDGGCEVTGYVVEKRDASKRQYTKVSSLEELETLVTDLTTGTSYMFRVAAKNEVGLSDFTELPQAVTAKSPHGKITVSSLFPLIYFTISSKYDLL